MKFLSCITLALGIAHQTVAALVPIPVPENATSFIGGPVFADPALFASEDALKQVQLAQHIRNAQVAYFQFGVDNIPRWGYSDYPPELINVLNIWKSQAEIAIEGLELILRGNNEPTVPPCTYAYAPYGGGTYSINSTDGYLFLLDFLLEVASGELAGYVGRAPSAVLALASATSAAVDARRGAYVRAIAGLDPSPNLVETVIGPGIAYNWIQYLVSKKDGCPKALDHYFPLNIVDVIAVDDVPLIGTHLTPALVNTRGSTLTFRFDDSESIHGANYYVYLSGTGFPQYVPLQILSKNTVKVVIPHTVAGIVFTAFTSSQKGKDFVSLEKHIVGGPYILHIV